MTVGAEWASIQKHYLNHRSYGGLLKCAGGMRQTLEFLKIGACQSNIFGNRFYDEFNAGSKKAEVNRDLHELEQTTGEQWKLITQFCIPIQCLIKGIAYISLPF